MSRLGFLVAILSVLLLALVIASSISCDVATATIVRAVEAPDIARHRPTSAPVPIMPATWRSP